LIPITAVEIRDMPCDPALESFREFTHYFAHAVPVDVVKGRPENFVSSTEQYFCFLGAPVFVNSCLDGGADFGVAHRDGDIFKGEDWIDEGSICDGVNELNLGNFIASNIELLWEGWFFEWDLVVGVALHVYPCNLAGEVMGV
jgi:hypothetical protein